MEEEGFHINILFITRKFPPTKGGMEKVAHELYSHISKKSNIKLISYNGPNIFLPLVLSSFVIRASWNLMTVKIDAVYLQDGLLSPLGVILKPYGKPIIITVHGLDITYKNRLYQYIIPRCIKKLDKVICVSSMTKEECTKRGISDEKLVIIPNGVSDELYLNEDKAVLRERLSNRINFSLNNKKILLSVGRIVRRKGFHWFVKNAIPKLMGNEVNFIYLIAGDGVIRHMVQNVIYEKELENKVIMLGKVDNETLKLLYNAADIFIMPNIPTPGDMEGFGVAALEAASCGITIVASELEGIKDAIVEGKNGILIEPYNVDEFVNKIGSLLKNDHEREKVGMKARKFTLENYNWMKISEIYLESFEELYGSQ